MRRDPLRRMMLCAVLGAPLPLAFIGGLLIQGEPHLHSDRAAFHILLPALLFGLMAFAIWILMRHPVSSVRR
jgi:hypothetical protein